MESVKLLLVHLYSVDIFSYSGPWGILGSEGKQNTALPVLGALELLHFPLVLINIRLVLMNRLNKTDSKFLLYM